MLIITISQGKLSQFIEKTSKNKSIFKSCFNISIRDYIISNKLMIKAISELKNFPMIAQVYKQVGGCNFNSQLPSPDNSLFGCCFFDLEYYFNNLQ